MKKIYILFLCLVPMRLVAQNLDFLLDDFDQEQVLTEIRDYLDTHDTRPGAEVIYKSLGKNNRYAWKVFCGYLRKERDYYRTYIDCLKKTAHLGDTHSQFLASIIYEKGITVEQDYQKVVALLQSASINNYAPAIASLSYMYFKGFGVGQDYNKSFELASIAAEMGNTSSYHRLGYCYEHGYGVEANREQAIAWYQLAESRGFKQSKVRLQLINNQLKSGTKPIHTPAFKASLQVDYPEVLPISNVYKKMEGAYVGSIYVYDWSKTHIINCLENVIELKLGHNTFTSLVDSTQNAQFKCHGTLKNRQMVFDNGHISYRNAWGGTDRVNLETCHLQAADGELLGHLHLHLPRQNEKFNPCVLVLKPIENAMADDEIAYIGLHPNPVKDQLTLSYSMQQLKPLNCRIYSLTGALVKQERLTPDTRKGQLTIDTKALKPGSYLIKVNAITKQFIKL
ncbi:MAG: T9SS type A sorting domain-containing protein [Carboxylicivirga sp.]|jgi:TPR repeat protein|nr:T9SS type A sorting domain-containing protein [Carboxylicivirga sp.]